MSTNRARRGPRGCLGLASSRGQGTQKGAEGEARAPSFRRAQLSGPLPGCQRPLRSGTASRASRKRYVVSHLDLDSAGCETAFPVSRETVMHVGLTLGRSDVTAHASRQRGSWASRPRPGP